MPREMTREEIRELAVKILQTLPDDSVEFSHVLNALMGATISICRACSVKEDDAVKAFRLIWHQFDDGVGGIH